MPNKLVIVESIAKIKTISKYLGSDFEVIASSGHIRDLPKKNSSIDILHDFMPTYQIIATKKKYVDDIIKKSKTSTHIYLATDPDREGEAIAWHIIEVLQKSKLLKDKIVERISFNEITEKAVLDAVKHPRKLDYSLVDAQQARMTLDFLIGFNISPLLWRKIRPGLSAGRVQSPALRLICEREDEIKAFVPEDYFSVHLHTSKKTAKLQAKLVEFEKKKIDVKTIKTLKDADSIRDTLSLAKTATVTNITKQQKKKNPLPPFITSSLQIDASRKCGFATDKTMKVAQSLYEGVEIGKESVGLISYMRTDSINLSETAIDDIRTYIKDNYDARYLPATAVKFSSKVKNAQEAHEAIRPTAMTRSPDSIKKYLSPDQFKLYELIWLRTLSCQMMPAILDTTKVDITVDNGIFRLNGITVNFDGFMKVYQETVNEDNTEEEGNVKLPELEINEILPINKIEHQQHQTEPKPRYSEASLVKTLEELGIGRPSTFVSIISTLKKREYVIMEKKRFIPTDIGAIVNKFLVAHLTSYVDYKFTANLEDTLDDISNASAKKLPVLQEFWKNLENVIGEKQNIARSELVNEKTGEACPECGKDLVIKLGKYGKFIGCSGYPECKHMRKINKDGSTDVAEKVELEIVEGRVCPKDGGTLVIRTGRFGKFISCKNYPKCKHIENIDQPAESDGPKIACPECKTGHIVTKKNRFGNWFFACDNYPKCKTLFNHKPIDEKCPECGYGILLHKVTKSKGEQTVCPKCDYVNP